MPINFNGKIVPNRQKIFDGNNRGFLYGDGLFETMRMFDGDLPFISLHVNRLLCGLEYLGFQTPTKYSNAFFKKEIKKIATGNSRIRMTVFRSSGGLYTPKNNCPKFLITTSKLNSNQFHFEFKPLKISIFEQEKLSCQPRSNFKTCNSIPYILAAKYKEEQNLNDCILLNEKNRIAEANSSNIFIIKKNTLITPSLSEGCINGVTRQLIIKIAQEKGIKIRERKVNSKEVLQAEEIWLTNSIQGIKCVSQIDSHHLPIPTLAPDFVNWINLKI